MNGEDEFISKLHLYSKRDEEKWRRVYRRKHEKKHCSECSHENTIYDNYCSECGHKLKNISDDNIEYKKYCKHCGEKLDKEDNYCMECGRKVIVENTKLKKCSVCGEWIGYDRYCSNCGHDTVKRSRLLVGHKEGSILKAMRDVKKGDIDIKLVKKCPNCNTEHQVYFNYCECCGTKLIKK